jgi:hypothetical protein
MEEFIRKAREAEKAGNWYEAQRYWMYEGGDYGKEQAEICKHIGDAIALGDRYRELTAGVYELWESHTINNRELHDILEKAHENVYGKRG